MTRTHQPPAYLPSHSGNMPLTKREIQILEIAKYPEKVIAGMLFISRDTVKTHMQNIRKKTGASSKAEVWEFFLTRNSSTKYIN